MNNECTCTLWTTNGEVRLCAVHHKYYRGPKELVSVSKVLREAWPFKPDFSQALPDVLEKARARGVLVDHLFSAFIAGQRIYIPAGTREDIIPEAKELFEKAVAWWASYQVGISPAHAQVILADDEIAGTCDLVTGGIIIDIKTVHSLEPTYELQLGAYGDLFEAYFGGPPAGLAILHLTKRFAAPKYIPLDLDACRRDWRLLREVWQMARRRSA